jgi:hypothetical protein
MLKEGLNNYLTPLFDFFSYFRIKRNEPFRLMAELYTGHLPYSQLEVSKLSWYGLGIYFKV